MVETQLPLGLILFGGKSAATDLVVRSTFDLDYINPSANRLGYLLTQFRVIITYMRLLVLPIGQNFDYEYPFFRSLLEPGVLVPIFLHLSIAAFSAFLFVLSRRGKKELRLVAFAIIWFYVALSVESTFIPLPMLIVEHRMYLPGLGAVTALVCGGFYLFSQMQSHWAKRVLALAFFVLPLMLSLKTYDRNMVWKDELSLWSDVVSKSPDNCRAQLNLGLAYSTRGEVQKAIHHYRAALALEPGLPGAYNNLGKLYMAKGLIEDAITHYEQAISLMPGAAAYHNNLSLAYKMTGNIEKAKEHRKEAERLKR